MRGLCPHLRAGGFSFASGYLQPLNAPTSPLRRDLRTREGLLPLTPCGSHLRLATPLGRSGHEPAIVSSSPVSSRVLRPESTIGQPPYSSECAFSRS